jgi:uncharacterized protein YndB with AHSA1/START domain
MMTATETLDAYGAITESATLTIQRMLPGPMERVWAYLTESDLRRKWLAAGEMQMEVGAQVELVWRNDELTSPPGQRPAGFSDEHRMECRITELDPPRRLAITWGSTGGVSFELAPRGDKVLLTVVHRRLPDRATMLNVGAGWHTHLDLLVARIAGDTTAPFWDSWLALKQDYEKRIRD